MTENKLICPFCNKKLEPIGTSGQFQCGTWGCEASFNFIATRDVWEYIDHTRKALDDFQEKLRVAMDALKEISLCYQNAEDRTETQWFVTARDMCDCADEALDEITKGGKDAE